MPPRAQRDTRHRRTSARHAPSASLDANPPPTQPACAHHRLFWAVGPPPAPPPHRRLCVCGPRPTPLTLPVMTSGHWAGSGRGAGPFWHAFSTHPSTRGATRGYSQLGNGGAQKAVGAARPAVTLEKPEPGRPPRCVSRGHRQHRVVGHVMGGGEIEGGGGVGLERSLGQGGGRVVGGGRLGWAQDWGRCTRGESQRA